MDKPKPIVVIKFPFQTDITKPESNPTFNLLKKDYHVIIITHDKNEITVELLNGTGISLVNKLLSNLIRKIYGRK